jgi:hypothetical protein
MAYFFVFAFFVSLLIAFHYLFLKKDQRWWEYTDYIWYGLAFLGILSAMAEFQYSSTLGRIADIEDSLKRTFFTLDRELDAAEAKECASSTNRCALVRDLKKAMRETEFARGWPAGPILFEGKQYTNSNFLLRELSTKHDIKLLDGLLAPIPVFTTMIMDLQATHGTASAVKRDRIPLMLLQLWPYLLAAAVAFRLTKVSSKLFGGSRGTKAPSPAPTE